MPYLRRRKTRFSRISSRKRYGTLSTRYRTKRRLVNRRGNRNRAGMQVNRNTGLPFASNYFCKLKCDNDVFFTDVATGTSQNQIVWGSDMNFPWNANTAGLPRPRYFDELSSIYDGYIINGCKIRVTLYPSANAQQTAGAVGGVQLCVYPVAADENVIDVASLETSIPQIRSQPMGKYKIASTTHPTTITSYVKSKRMSPAITSGATGSTTDLMGRFRQFDDTALCSVAQNTGHWFWVISIGDLSGVSTDDYRVAVQTTYYVKCIKRDLPPASVNPTVA